MHDHDPTPEEFREYKKLFSVTTTRHSQGAAMALQAGIDLKENYFQTSQPRLFVPEDTTIINTLLGTDAVLTQFSQDDIIHATGIGNSLLAKMKAFKAAVVGAPTPSFPGINIVTSPATDIIAQTGRSGGGSAQGVKLFMPGNAEPRHFAMMTRMIAAQDAGAGEPALQRAALKTASLSKQVPRKFKRE